MIQFTSLIISLLAFIFALTIHEFCHALTAYLLGDPTAQKMGRLTLNPLAHIDPLGLLFLILIRFGWARPVPFDPRNFTYPRFYLVLVGLAGPTSNFIVALICLIIYHHMLSYFSLTIYIYAAEFLKASVWINVMLGVFNLIPIPPLDGSHLLRSLLPESLLPYYYRFERISFIALILLLAVPAIRIFLKTAIATTLGILENLVI